MTRWRSLRVPQWRTFLQKQIGRGAARSHVAGVAPSAQYAAKVNGLSNLELRRVRTETRAAFTEVETQLRTLFEAKADAEKKGTPASPATSVIRPPPTSMPPPSAASSALSPATCKRTRPITALTSSTVP